MSGERLRFTQSLHWVSQMHEKHGHSGENRLYRIWNAMRQRCGKSYRSNYAEYGGRGIRVCDQWQQSFPAFKAWAEANGYSASLSIDRKDATGNYEPDNCRWATPKEQADNREWACWVEAEGERRTVAEWAKIKGMHLTTLYRRYRRGFRDASIFDLSITRPRLASLEEGAGA